MDKAENKSISQLSGLGPKSQALLAAAGITTVEQHRALGSVACYARLRQQADKVSLNMLWALESALTGIHWQVVAREHRTSLLLALEQFENNDRECQGAAPEMGETHNNAV